MIGTTTERTSLWKSEKHEVEMFNYIFIQVIKQSMYYVGYLYQSS